MFPLSNFSAPGKTRVQTGFPARITSSYDSATGYEWEMLVLDTDTATPEVARVTNPATGNYAFCPDDDQTLTDGTEGWLEPDPLGQGWLFLRAGSGSGGTTIIVKEVDGSPSYTNVTELRFDQTDGFVLSQPAAGVARVDAAAASASQAGIVSLADQTFGLGTKTAEVFGVDVGGAGGGYFAPVDTGGGVGFFQGDTGGEGTSTSADAQVWAGQFVANTGMQAPFFESLSGTGYFVNSVAVIDGSGFFRPVSSADGSAPNNSIYYSTTAGKLVYKDSGGTVNNLY